MIDDKRVLIVEDDGDAMDIYATMLETRGFTVFRAADGSEAVAVLESAEPDVVVLDLVLPGELQGWDVLSEIRSRSRTDDVPCIIVTADARPEHARRAADMGAVFLLKPLAPEALAEEVVRRCGNDPETQRQEKGR